jgi:hypothetical protein
VAYDFRLTEKGAAWDADVYREDWRALGVDGVAVTNTVSVHNGRLAIFTSNCPALATCSGSVECGGQARDLSPQPRIGSPTKVSGYQRTAPDWSS